MRSILYIFVLRLLEDGDGDGYGDGDGDGEKL